MKRAGFKTLWGAAILAVLVPAPLFAAGQVDVRTYYDIPDGDFKSLTVNGNTQLSTNAGNVVLNRAAGGFTGIGGANAGPQRLLVAGNLNGLATVGLMDGAGNGVNLGGSGGAYGLVEARNGGDLRLNPNGGSVIIGGTAGVGANRLMVSDAGGGGATLGVTQTGQTGEVRVAWATDGGATNGYYATYAT